MERAATDPNNWDSFGHSGTVDDAWAVPFEPGCDGDSPMGFRSLPGLAVQPVSACAHECGLPGKPE
jgi:hypothetical protein